MIPFTRGMPFSWGNALLPAGAAAFGKQLFVKQLFDKILSGDLEMSGYFGKNSGERSDSERSMIWNGQMMFPMISGSQSHMTASLACDLIAELAKGFGKFRTGEVTGESHAAMVSSLTKWSRMILGTWEDSK